MKILVSDYDGTFYINDEDIEVNKKAVCEFEKQGNIFMIATGRSYLDFKNEAKAYNIDYNYVILNHGATIIDSNDNILYNVTIDNNIISKIKNEICIEKSINHFCCSGLESRAYISHNDLTKIHMKYEKKEDAIKTNNILNSKYSDYIISFFLSNGMVEIVSNQVNKSKAIKFLTNKFNIDDKDIYTIGDACNDIDMVKDFNGYAMENSEYELKKVAIKEYKSVSDLIKEIME